MALCNLFFRDAQPFDVQVLAKLGRKCRCRVVGVNTLTIHVVREKSVDYINRYIGILLLMANSHEMKIKCYLCKKMDAQCPFGI